MKLRNKLIPIFSVAAATTVAAPLISSCGTVELKEMDMIDVLHGYIPSTGRAEGAVGLTRKAVEDIYIKAIQDNPEIFKQDLAWFESMAVKSRLNMATYGSYEPANGSIAAAEAFGGKRSEGSLVGEMRECYGLVPASTASTCFTMIPQIAKFGLSDLKLNKVKLVNPNTEKEEEVNTISMKFNYEYQIEINGDCVGVNDKLHHSTIKRVVNTSLTSEYKNIPFHVRFDSVEGLWMVEPMGWTDAMGGSDEQSTLWMLTKLTDYALTFDFKQITTDTIKDYNNNVDTHTYDGSLGGVIDSYAKLMAWIRQPISGETKVGDTTPVAEETVRQYFFNFGSYYLYDIMGPTWAVTNFGNANNTTINVEAAATNAAGDYHATMSNAISYNLSYAQIRSGAGLVQKDGVYAKLLDPQSTLSFILYKLPTEEGKTKEPIGTVSFLPENNKNCMAYGDETHYNITLDAIYSFETGYKPAEVDKDTLLDDDKYVFTVPSGTTFNFEVYHENQITHEIVAETISCTLDADINCFWGYQSKTIDNI